MVVYKLDRFARNMGDHTMVRMALASVGVQLRAVYESIDETAQGKLTENIMAALAQYDNDA